MYRENEFYYITDKLHHDVYNVALREHLDKEERLVVKVFEKDDERIVIETSNGKDTYIFDNRKDKDSSIYDYDLIFVKMMERYVSSYELHNMYYESIEGVGSWYRVNISEFDPTDKDLEIFYKKKVTKEIILKSSASEDIKNKQLKFLEITKGIRFTEPKKVIEMFNKIK